MRKNGGPLKEVCKIGEVLPTLEETLRKFYKIVYQEFMGLVLDREEIRLEDLCKVQQSMVLNFLLKKKIVDDPLAKSVEFQKLFPKKIGKYYGGKKFAESEKELGLEDFFDVLLFCAKKRYKEKSVDEAIEFLCQSYFEADPNDSLLIQIEGLITDLRSKVCSQECDKILKKYQEALRKIFYTLCHPDENEKPVFSFSSFFKLFKSANLFGEGLTPSDLKLAYFMISDLQKEIPIEKFFLCLTKVADMISPFPLGYKNVKII